MRSLLLGLILLSLAGCEVLQPLASSIPFLSPQGAASPLAPAASPTATPSAGPDSGGQADNGNVTIDLPPGAVYSN